MVTRYDVIVIGAGSVGIPTAMACAAAGQKVLVLDEHASPGQGENKHAIGGIRATHANKAKIVTCQKSIEIFKTWEEKHGENIEWIEGGYTFVAYTEEQEKLLKDMIPIQQSYGLEIDYVDAEKIKEIVTGINPNELRGGTWSPKDGSASPLVSINSFYRQAKVDGAEFNFKEEVTHLDVENGRIAKIRTDKNIYESDWVINAAGAGARRIGEMLGIDLPVYNDSHEAGVTEPVKRFFEPMVVDIRPSPGSKNYYFYQDKHGSLVFCITPDPPIIGTDVRETSIFLPQVAKRMVDLLPRLKNIKVRRTWRGLYPMSPDGNPIVGPVKEIQGFINAIGMCGQGFMLGPGISELLSRITTDKLTDIDKEVLEELSMYREFETEEKLK
ncbi:MAG: NAD(P)/FAD-dependent oxidoreductase [Candidatus Hodarchaeales archaeon]|jgi:sarcosine oxidase subunit beta